jgi:membrane-associated phospholipid phosphatase
METVMQWSIDVIVALQRASPGLDGVMRFLTFLGREEFFLLATTFIYWCLSPTWGMRALAVLLLSDGLNGIFKWTFHEPRPYWISAQVRAIGTETSYGIPSGHAQTGAAFWGLNATVLRQRWAWMAAAVLVGAISLSRLYLGVHFLHDVFSGWIIGALLLLAYVRVEARVGIRVASWPLWIQIAAAFLGSMLIAGVSLLVWSGLTDIVDPAAWAAQAAAAAPPPAGEHAIDPRALTGAVSTWGTMFGIGGGWALARRSPFDPRGRWTIRAARLVVGLVVVLVLRVGLGAVFPAGADAVALVFRYVRYSLVGLTAVWLVPWVFVRTGLARASVPDAPVIATPRPPAPARRGP